MTMTPTEVDAAAAALAEYREAERMVANLASYEVNGVRIKRSTDMIGNGSFLDAHSGSGPFGIGWPEELEAALTAAFQTWLADRLATTKAAAEASGVTGL